MMKLKPEIHRIHFFIILKLCILLDFHAFTKCMTPSYDCDFLSLNPPKHTSITKRTLCR